MKPHLLNVSTGASHSFSGRRDLQPDINSMWHYHEEIELVYFKKGKGIQFVGDSIANFKDGDVVLIGSNLPHYWRFDLEYFKENTNTSAEVYVLHFKEDFWGQAFLNLPENLEIKKIISKCKQGIQVHGVSRKILSELIPEIIDASGSDRIIGLVNALKQIARAQQTKTLASLGFRFDFQLTEKDRIQSIYNYAINNYKKKIELKEIADIAGMSPNSFCKFFRAKSRKTFTQFLNEIRIGQACKLLIEDRLSVKEICYESGFYNFTSFHQSFKGITGKSPLRYAQEFIPKPGL